MERAVGLFAGIGGLELGLHEHGWRTELFCEIDPAAQAVLRRHFPDVAQAADVTKLRSLPAGVGLVAAGFPCQDLSQAGRTAGISGARSGLVDQVFRLVCRRRGGPRWLLLENVPFMLSLEQGRAMRHLTETLAGHGFAWAYRVVDARAFGLPQRRLRVVLLASRDEDPRSVLFREDAGPSPAPGPADGLACGFYWTEGVRGLGWAVDATPTLKGGSTIGIPSPPAVVLPGGEVVTPGITDVERLQGFAAGWTEPATAVAGRPGHRWRLVGNAVSTRVSAWVGEGLAAPVGYSGSGDRRLAPGEPWPRAAWGVGGEAFRVDVSPWPRRAPYTHLHEFLREPASLSARATAGFLRRTERGSLRFAPGFLDDVRAHLARMGGDPARAA